MESTSDGIIACIGLCVIFLMIGWLLGTFIPFFQFRERGNERAEEIKKNRSKEERDREEIRKKCKWQVGDSVIHKLSEEKLIVINHQVDWPDEGGLRFNSYICRRWVGGKYTAESFKEGELDDDPPADLYAMRIKVKDIGKISKKKWWNW